MTSTAREQGGAEGHGRPDHGATPDPIPPELDLTRVPVHVACVMDGNGRWASARGLPRTEGHGAGETALLDVVNGALEIGIKWITLYAFSTENWRRPPDEVRYLMNFNQSLLMRRRDELNEKGVQIRFAGRRDWRVPRRVLKRMDESIELTKDNRRMVMTMAFNYGGRAEIVDAVRALVAEGTSANKIDEKAIRRHLYFPDMPDPDLVIRTSGETRISNFLLWEIAYSELVFPDVLWPDVRRRHLYEAVLEYQRRVRRFGAVNPRAEGRRSRRRLRQTAGGRVAPSYLPTSRHAVLDPLRNEQGQPASSNGDQGSAAEAGESDAAGDDHQSVPTRRSTGQSPNLSYAKSSVHLPARACAVALGAKPLLVRSWGHCA